jgi:hypothetical protein
MDIAALHSYRLRPATHYVAQALVLSLAIHLVFFGALELGWYLRLRLPEWLKAVLPRVAARVEERKNPPPARQEIPLVFVEVDPSQAVAEPPKDTKNYSIANSLAANPDVSVDSNKSKIDGAQDKVPKIFDTLRPLPPQALTAMKPEPQRLKPEPETKPAEKPGDLALAKPPDPKPKEEEKPKRPRTLIEAQVQKGLIPGQKLKQEGGTPRHGTIASLDARATPFAAYDQAIINAIAQRWYDILDSSTTPTRPGEVVMEFRLHYDGSVTDLKVVETNVGDLLALFCQKAVSDPAPFEKWPAEMRRAIGRDYREIRFAFYYEY